MHLRTVHVHWCVHAASSCLKLVLIPYCWSVALEKKKKKEGGEGREGGKRRHITVAFHVTVHVGGEGREEKAFHSSLLRFT